MWSGSLTSGDCDASPTGKSAIQEAWKPALHFSCVEGITAGVYFGFIDGTGSIAVARAVAF